MPRATPGAPSCAPSLDDAGVRPAVLVTDPRGQPVSRVRDRALPLRRPRGRRAPRAAQLDVETSFGRDGVTVYEDAQRGRVVRREVDVALPRATHVTNARTGEALGETARLHTTLTAGDALVLALGPAPAPLRLEGPPRPRSAGDAAAFTACRAGSRAPAAALARVRARTARSGPSTRASRSRRSRERRFRLPSALNDPAGEYRVRVADVLSGAAGRGDAAPRVRRSAMTRWITAAVVLAALACAGSPGDGSPAGASPGAARRRAREAAPTSRPTPSGTATSPRPRSTAQSAAVIANLDRVGWGLGRMQIDFSIEVLAADAETPLRAFTPTDDFFSPDCDLDPVPVPPGGALEGEEGYECRGDGDCHLIVADRSRMRLFEMWRADIRGDSFRGGCLAVWDMTRVYPPSGRGEQCTSADAAGFPIAPLLFDADEVAAGRVDHAIRFILPNATIRAREYVHPATHGTRATSGPPDAPPYGARLRLRADYPLASLPNEGARVVARAHAALRHAARRRRARRAHRAQRPLHAREVGGPARPARPRRRCARATSRWSPRATASRSRTIASAILEESMTAQAAVPEGGRGPRRGRPGARAADVRPQLWQGHDFGPGPVVSDRLDQGPFGIEQDEGWYTIATTTPSGARVRNPGLGLVGYTWEENGPALAARAGRATLEQSVEALASLPFVDVLYIRCDWRDVQSRPGRLDLAPGLGAHPRRRAPPRPARRLPRPAVEPGDPARAAGAAGLPAAEGAARHDPLGSGRGARARRAALRPPRVPAGPSAS